MKMRNLCFCCKKFCKEFKEFAILGNVFNLAIGIIIGTAFSNVVKSLVEDMITPPFGFLLGGVDFSNLTIKIRNFVYTDQPPVVVRYGKFVQEIIYLLIIGLVLFFLIKLINKLQQIRIKRQFEEQKNVKIELSDEGKILLDIRNILARKIVLVDEILM